VVELIISKLPSETLQNQLASKLTAILKNRKKKKSAKTPEAHQT
jgi:hypothetical protein